MSKKAMRSTGKLRALIKNWAVPVGCGLIFLILLKCVFFVGVVPTTSMEPTIKQGSVILGVRVFGELRRGDVIVFEHQGRLLVKRIAAVADDTVSVNGRPQTVPDGCFYMLGDNAADSIDSRYWDEPFVTREQIVAVLCG
jgi:signal peptidase I